MAEDLKMKYGEELWHKKHNALVDVVENMGGSKRPLLDQRSYWNSRHK